ncbi:MAG: aminotransferase class I/II-fold pyridoxal phosphate-dependent enzyme, partial [Burkholderiales bacterium]|nr:aminotransferase class I/II-fold pyridoxal phosphate-dependent enzyme [Burkholderiales bacterium]
YADYEDAARMAGVEIERMALDPANDFTLDFDQLEKRLRPGQLVMLGQPNNPTGRVFDVERLREFVHAFPQT